MHKGCINIKDCTCRGWAVLPDTEGCTPSQPAQLPVDHSLLYRTVYVYTGIYKDKQRKTLLYCGVCPGVQVIPALYGFYMPLYTVYKEYHTRAV